MRKEKGLARKRGGLPLDEDVYISALVLARSHEPPLLSSPSNKYTWIAMGHSTFSFHNAASTAAMLLLAAVFFSSAVASDPLFSCGPSSPSRAYPFCDRSLPAARRAADLVSRLTVAEKVSQLGDEAAGVPRLGVPPYKWWSEGLHGLAFWGHGMRFNGTVTGVTSFPQVLLTTASFDDGLWFRIGQVRNVHIPATRRRAMRLPANIQPRVLHRICAVWGRVHCTVLLWQ